MSGALGLAIGVATLFGVGLAFVCIFPARRPSVDDDRSKGYAVSPLRSYRFTVRCGCHERHVDVVAEDVDRASARVAPTLLACMRVQTFEQLRGAVAAWGEDLEVEEVTQ